MVFNVSGLVNDAFGVFGEELMNDLDQIIAWVAERAYDKGYDEGMTDGPVLNPPLAKIQRTAVRKIRSLNYERVKPNPELNSPFNRQLGPRPLVVKGDVREVQNNQQKLSEIHAKRPLSMERIHDIPKAWRRFGGGQ